MKLFTFVIVAMMLSGIAMAAEVPTSEGDKALVFMFHGLDDLALGTYGGTYGVGMRYYIDDDTAIRGGVQFGNWSETEVANDPENYEDVEETYSVYGASVIYEKHMESACSSVSPYWGVGAAFSMFTDEYLDGDGDTETDTGTGFAGFGVVGFEWGFTNCMTLGGEYQLGFWSWSGETEFEPSRVSVTYDEFDGTYMGFSSASVYLSVYF